MAWKKHKLKEGQMTKWGERCMREKVIQQKSGHVASDLQKLYSIVSLLNYKAHYTPNYIGLSVVTLM